MSMRATDLVQQNVSSVTLTKVRQRFATRVAPNILKHTIIETIPSIVADELAYRLTLFLAGKVKEETYTSYKTIKYPKTWWEAVKERFFSARLKKMFPVVYEEHRIAETTKTFITKVCPHMDIAFNEREHLQFFFTE